MSCEKTVQELEAELCNLKSAKYNIEADIDKVQNQLDVAKNKNTPKNGDIADYFGEKENLEKIKNDFVAIVGNVFNR